MIAAVDAALEALPINAKLDRKALIQLFGERGVAKPTLYRWIDEHLRTGSPGQRLGAKVRAAARKRAEKRLPKKAFRGTLKHAEIDRVAEHLPKLTTMDEIAGSGPIGVISHLNDVIATAKQVMVYARDADTGKPRAARLLLAAAEGLRRCLETANRIAAKMHQLQKIEDFHEIIMEEIRQESPDCARRILDRIDKASGEWGAV